MELVHYYHAGLGESLKKSVVSIIHVFPIHRKQININVNVEDLPLTKSSGS